MTDGDKDFGVPDSGVPDLGVANAQNSDEWVSQMLAESLLGETPAADGPSQGTIEGADAVSVHPPPAHRPVATIGTDIDPGDGGAPGEGNEPAVPGLDEDIEIVSGEEDVSDPSTAEGTGGRGSNDDPDVGDDDRASFGRFVGEWVVVLVGAVAFALVLRAALFQAFWIPSESMESTLQLQDRVLVNKVSYRLHDVNRGDVVVFRRPDDEPAEIRDLIKRVIGLPGETVEGRDNAVWINGQRLDESYLADDEVILPFGPITVEDGHVFVMGDNRDESLDSRFFGAVPEDRIVGRAFVLFWPIDRVGFL